MSSRQPRVTRKVIEAPQRNSGRQSAAGSGRQCEIDSSAHRLSRVREQYAFNRAVEFEKQEFFTSAYFRAHPPEDADLRSPAEKLEDLQARLQPNLPMAERFSLLVQIKSAQYMLHGEDSIEALRAHAEIGFYYADVPRPASCLRHLELAHELEPRYPLGRDESLRIAVEMADAYLKTETEVRPRTERLVKPYQNTPIEDPRLRFKRDRTCARLAKAQEKFGPAGEHYRNAVDSLSASNGGNDTPETAELHKEIARMFELAKNDAEAGEEYQKAYDVYIRLGMEESVKEIEPKLARVAKQTKEVAQPVEPDHGEPPDEPVVNGEPAATEQEETGAKAEATPTEAAPEPVETEAKEAPAPQPDEPEVGGEPGEGEKEAPNVPLPDEPEADGKPEPAGKEEPAESDEVTPTDDGDGVVQAEKEEPPAPVSDEPEIGGEAAGTEKEEPEATDEGVPHDAAEPGEVSGGEKEDAPAEGDLGTAIEEVQDEQAEPKADEEARDVDHSSLGDVIPEDSLTGPAKQFVEALTGKHAEEEEVGGKEAASVERELPPEETHSEAEAQADIVNEPEAAQEPSDDSPPAQRPEEPPAEPPEEPPQEPGDDGDAEATAGDVDDNIVVEDAIEAPGNDAPVDAVTEEPGVDIEEGPGKFEPSDLDVSSDGGDKAGEDIAGETEVIEVVPGQPEGEPDGPGSDTGEEDEAPAADLVETGTEPIADPEATAKIPSDGAEHHEPEASEQPPPDATPERPSGEEAAKEDEKEEEKEEPTPEPHADDGS
jgi:hypothetical protein